MRNINKTVWELLLGVLFLGIILEIVGVMLVRDKLYYSIGLGIGIILAIFMTFSIHSSVVKAIDVGEHGAKAKMITSYVFRTVLVVAVILIMAVTRLGSLAGLLIGMMTLKVAAYIQPITHKFLTGGKG